MTRWCWLKSVLILTASLGGIRICEAADVNAAVLEYLITLLETSTAGVSPKCLRDISNYVESVATREPWALKMLDSTGKLSDGILDGNVVFLGFFSECLDVFKDPSPNETLPSKFTSRYCLATFSLANARKDPPKVSACNNILHLCCYYLTYGSLIGSLHE